MVAVNTQLDLLNSYFPVNASLPRVCVQLAEDLRVANSYLDRGGDIQVVEVVI